MVSSFLFQIISKKRRTKNTFISSLAFYQGWLGVYCGSSFCAPVILKDSGKKARDRDLEWMKNWNLCCDWWSCELVCFLKWLCYVEAVLLVCNKIAERQKHGVGWNGNQVPLGIWSIKWWLWILSKACLVLYFIWKEIWPIRVDTKLWCIANTLQYFGDVISIQQTNCWLER